MTWVSVAIGADPEVEEKELVFKFETYLPLKPYLHFSIRLNHCIV
jgi:hypothetical protein